MLKTSIAQLFVRIRKLIRKQGVHTITFYPLENQILIICHSGGKSQIIWLYLIRKLFKDEKKKIIIIII